MTKRFGNLFEEVASFENLRMSFRLASKGKAQLSDVVQIRYDLETRLFDLRRRLLAGQYRFGPYKAFRILEPKPRDIVAAPFEDRIVHHAICNVLIPIFEKTFIHDSYACRAGKGTHMAVLRLQEHMRRQPHAYVLQCDVRKYFRSVDHEVLKGLIRRKIKDGRLLSLVDPLIDSCPVHPDFGEGKGLPIGNLSSQLFANVYLDPLDHFVSEELAVGRFVRYVDDWVLVHPDKQVLLDAKITIESYIGNRLHLSLHTAKCHVRPCRAGVTFLGYRVWPALRRVKTATMVRIRRQEKALREQYWLGRIDERQYQQGVSSLLGHVRWGDGSGTLSEELMS